MIDKNIILNQQQPPIVISDYLVKDREQIINSLNLKTREENGKKILLSNNREYSRGIISELLEYFNSPFVRATPETFSDDKKYYYRIMTPEENNTGYSLYRYYCIGTGKTVKKNYRITELFQEQVKILPNNYSIGKLQNACEKTSFYMPGLPGQANIYSRFSFNQSDFNNSIFKLDKFSSEWDPDNHLWNSSSINNFYTTIDQNSYYCANKHYHSLLSIDNSYWEPLKENNGINENIQNYLQIFYFSSGEERSAKLNLFDNLVNKDVPFFPYYDNSTSPPSLIFASNNINNIQKLLIKYLNYFIFCIQEKLYYGQNKSQFSSWNIYRSRINKEKNSINLKIVGNFNINPINMTKINIIFYKQDSQNPIGNISFSGNEFNAKIKEDSNNSVFEAEINNSTLGLKKNRVYKLLLEITYSNGEKTKTNYGLISVFSDENKKSFIKELDNSLNIEISSQEAFPSYIKKTQILNTAGTETLATSNENYFQRQNNGYEPMKINNLKEEYLYYKGQILNPYLGEEENSTGISARNIVDNNNTNIGYYMPKLESIKNYNCWLLNGLQATTTATSKITIMYPTSTNYNNSKTLLIPRSVFDVEPYKNKKFNFSIEQTYLMERQDTSTYCTPWLFIVPMRQFNDNNKESMEKVTKVFNDYLNSLLSKNYNGIFETINNGNNNFENINFFNTISCFNNPPDYDQLLNVNAGFYETKSGLKVFVVRKNDGNFYDVINDTVNYGTYNDIKNNFITSRYFYGGLTINNNHYIPSNNLYQWHPRLIDKENQTEDYYNNKRLSLDFDLADNDKYILVNIFSTDVDSYMLESTTEKDKKIEFNKKNLERIKSVRIVPADENKINSKEYAYPLESKKYYVYEDKFENIDSMTTSCEVEAIMSNGERLKTSINLNNTNISNVQMPNFTSASDSQPFNYELINNYEKGYIELTISKNNSLTSTQNNTVSTLQFKILRKREDLNIYDEIGIIKGESLYAINKSKKYLIKDYGVEQGYKYIYYLEPFAEDTVYTKKEIGSQKCDFDHIILIDSEKSFIIKFNPKVSTYKTVQLEAKIDTIGNQYPFIRKNGNVNYKQFNLGGLISELAEDQNDTDGRLSTWASGINYVEKDKVYSERIYKNELLKWLNNGKNKLLKTSTEGNYIVQLMNINLSPMEQLGRLLHSFTCDAYETMDYTQENLNNNLHFNEINIELI